jgi:hypothetical protein
MAEILLTWTSFTPFSLTCMFVCLKYCWLEQYSQGVNEVQVSNISAIQTHVKPRWVNNISATQTLVKPKWINNVQVSNISITQIHRLSQINIADLNNIHSLKFNLCACGSHNYFRQIVTLWSIYMYKVTSPVYLI